MEEQNSRIEQIITDLEPGYDQLRPLGSGGMGDLFLAHKKGLNVPVAVKILKDNIKTKLDEHREAEILKSLKHQYLPKIYDIIMTPQGVLYTIMDYIPGDNLKDYVKKHGPVDQKTAYKWAAQLCEVTAYLHSQNPAIIHSDIKPGNVMITPNGDICLIDFNTSLQMRDGLTAVGKTDGYAAPEQYTRSDVVLAGMQQAAGLPSQFTGDEVFSEVDSPKSDDTVLPSSRSSTSFSLNRQRSSFSSSSRTKGGSVIDYGPVTKCTDVYAIGATLYFALTGKTPPHALKEGKSLSDLHPRISRSFLQIIERSMEKTANKRFCDAAEMGRALAEIQRFDLQYRKLRILTFLAVCLEVFLLVGGIGLVYTSQAQIKKETENNYIHILNEVQQQRDVGNYDEALALVNDAKALMDTRMEAYAEQAVIYYKESINTSNDERREQLLSLCVDAVQELLDGGYEGGTAAEWSKVYFVGAESCLELGNYTLAEKWYSDSIAYLPTQNNYTGYIYDLAMEGKLDEAEKNLKQMQNVLPKEDPNFAVNLLGAELDRLNGRYMDAIEKYKKMLNSTQDELLLRRGYLSVNDTLAQAETVNLNYSEDNHSQDDLLTYADARIFFMKEAIERLPASKTIFLPLLADAYYTRYLISNDNSDEYLNEARNVYESLEKNALDFSDRLILNRIYIIQEEWNLAITDLQEMDILFKDNYKIAFLLAKAYIGRGLQHAEKYDVEHAQEDLAAASAYLLKMKESYAASGDSDPEVDGLIASFAYASEEVSSGQTP